MNNEDDMYRNGTLLKHFIDKYHKRKNKDNYLLVIRCLYECYIWIPIKVIISDEDKKTFFEGKAGDTISIKNNVLMEPEILQSEEDKFYLPIFSSIDQMGKEYENSSKTQRSFIEAVQMAVRREYVSGIALDPLGQQFIIEKELFKYLIKT